MRPASLQSETRWSFKRGLLFTSRLKEGEVELQVVMIPRLVEAMPTMANKTATRP